MFVSSALKRGSHRLAFVLVTQAKSTAYCQYVPGIVSSLVRHAQTSTSAVGPNAFYPSDVKIDSAQTVIRMNESDEKSCHSQLTPPAVIAKAYIHVNMDTSTPCEVQLQLQKLAPKMNEVVFFYNEKTPHLGLMLNIKEHIYNHYKMLGPIKRAWYQILVEHTTLTDLLTHHLRHTDKSTDYKSSLGELSQLLDTVEMKKGVSSCKYEKSVRQGNLIQFNYRKLLPKELTVLQVLAQYAHYDYEII